MIHCLICDHPENVHQLQKDGKRYCTQMEFGPDGKFIYSDTCLNLIKTNLEYLEWKYDQLHRSR